MRVVTSYPNPDLDGISSGLGYAELLSGEGTPTKALFVGLPDKESAAALAWWKVTADFTNTFSLRPGDELVLVDFCWLGEFPAGVSPDRVVEVLDHHPWHDGSDFPRATVQNEAIGAVATLVSERYQAAGRTPSKPVAGLLAGAISSNTIRFRTPNTTPRDRAAFGWLSEIAAASEDYFTHLRRARSTFAPGDIQRALEHDATVWTKSPAGNVACLQLEAQDVLALFRSRRGEFDAAIAAVMQEKAASLALVNLIDIERGESALYASDARSRAFLTSRLGVSFGEEGLALPHQLLMRKQIMPRL